MSDKERIAQLEAENKKLRKQVAILRRCLMSDKERIAQLEAENKKLRKQVAILKDSRNLLEDSMERIHDLAKVFTNEPCYVTGHEDELYDAEEDGNA